MHPGIKSFKTSQDSTKNYFFIYTVLKDSIQLMTVLELIITGHLKLFFYFRKPSWKFDSSYFEFCAFDTLESNFESTFYNNNSIALDLISSILCSLCFCITIIILFKYINRIRGSVRLYSMIISCLLQHHDERKELQIIYVD